MIGRGAILAVMALGVGATALPQHDDRPPWLVWNASASVPIGLYAVDTIIDAHTGDLVVVRPPEPLARFLADRGYLPRGVPLLKHVAALAGQTVCRIGRSVTVDAIEMGEARERDGRGRALPVWEGCRVIAPGRSFPDEPAVRRLARRTLFRPAARRLDRRPRDPSLGPSNRRGGVIVPPSRESAAITPGDNRAGHSVISAGSCARGSADHRVSSAANPARCVIGHGRRECASALAVRPFGDVRRVGLLVLGSAVRRFGPRRAGFDRRHGKPTLRPSLHSLRRGGLAEIQYSRRTGFGRLCGSRAVEIRAPFRQRAQWG